MTTPVRSPSAIDVRTGLVLAGIVAVPTAIGAAVGSGFHKTKKGAVAGLTVGALGVLGIFVIAANMPSGGAS